MGLLLYILGLAQIALGVLILVGGWFMGEQIAEPGALIGGATAMLLVGVVGGAFTMIVTGLITVAIGSIYNGVKRLERRATGETSVHYEPEF